MPISGGTAQLIKLRHCFIKHNGKEQNSGNYAINSGYYDNYKTRLSMTRAIFYWPKTIKKLTLFYQKIDFIDQTNQWNETTSP